tara:strand:- start:6766 stop:9702 length:2937 start_codon:yes stop_codon:yes gene_type:complete
MPTDEQLWYQMMDKPAKADPLIEARKKAQEEEEAAAKAEEEELKQKTTDILRGPKAAAKSLAKSAAVIAVDPLGINPYGAADIVEIGSEYLGKGYDYLKEKISPEEVAGPAAAVAIGGLGLSALGDEFGAAQYGSIKDALPVFQRQDPVEGSWYRIGRGDEFTELTHSPSGGYPQMTTGRDSGSGVSGQYAFSDEAVKVGNLNPNSERITPIKPPRQPLIISQYGPQGFSASNSAPQFASDAKVIFRVAEDLANVPPNRRDEVIEALRRQTFAAGHTRRGDAKTRIRDTNLLKEFNIDAQKYSEVTDRLRDATVKSLKDYSRRARRAGNIIGPDPIYLAASDLQFGPLKIVDAMADWEKWQHVHPMNIFLSRQGFDGVDFRGHAAKIGQTLMRGAVKFPPIDYEGRLVGVEPSSGKYIQLAAEREISPEREAQLRTAIEQAREAEVRSRKESAAFHAREEAQRAEEAARRPFKPYTGPSGADWLIEALEEVQAREAAAPEAPRAAAIADHLADLGGSTPKLNPDGTITLYHRTTPEAANEIRRTGRFISRENTREVFFSNQPQGQGSGYGTEIVEVRVNPKDVRLDDAFDNEIHVAVNRSVAETGLRAAAPEAPRAAAIATPNLPFDRTKTPRLNSIIESDRYIVTPATPDDAPDNRHHFAYEIAGTQHWPQSHDIMVDPDSGRQFPRGGRSYNPEIVEPKRIEDKWGVRHNYELKPGWAQDIDTNPELMYRGMSWEEWQAIQETGRIQSRGDYNLGPEQKGLTYFTSDAGQAVSYAHGFAPVQHKATPSKPAVVIAVRRRKGVPVSGTGVTEIGIRGSISADDIVEVWEGHVATTDSGRTDVIDDFHGLRDGSGSAPSSVVAWKQPQVRDAPQTPRTSRPKRGGQGTVGTIGGIAGLGIAGALAAQAARGTVPEEVRESGVEAFYRFKGGKPVEVRELDPKSKAVQAFVENEEALQWALQNNRISEDAYKQLSSLRK